MTESRPEAVPKTAGLILPSVSCDDTMPKTPLAMKARTITRAAVTNGFAPEGRKTKTPKSKPAMIEPQAMTRDGEPTFSATPPKMGADRRDTP